MTDLTTDETKSAVDVNHDNNDDKQEVVQEVEPTVLELKKPINKAIVNSARYASIDVYEVNWKSIPVMKRKRDNYVNASQILKAAKVEKKKRKKVLKRLCELVPFEKIEFGFHTFQGIWVPETSAKKLADKWQVLDPLMPLFDK